MNLADRQPARFAEMLAEWEAYAKSVGYIQADGDRVLAHMAPEAFFSRYGSP